MILCTDHQSHQVDIALVDVSQVSGQVYHGGEELTNLIVEAFRTFAVSNPIHPEVRYATLTFLVSSLVCE